MLPAVLESSAVLLYARIVEAWLRSWSRSLCYRMPLARCAWLELHSAVLLQCMLLLQDLLCANQGCM